MSIPRELLEQLLTGYLDDVLSADERARVEQLLQSDDEIATEFAQLRELQQSFKAISRADSAIQLDDGFADRVLGAAVARAHAEGLREDHPLVRLSEKPIASSIDSASKTSQRSRLRFAGVLVGLAASIMFAVIALRPEARGPEARGPEARGPEAPEVAPIAIADLRNAPPFDPTVPVEPKSVVIDSLPTAIASSSVDSSAVSDSIPTMSAAPKPAATAIAKSEMTPKKPDAPDPRESPIKISRITSILVVDVRLTQVGRDSGAVSRAMKMVGMRPTSQKKITDEVAGFVNESLEPGDDTSVLYLQASAKKIDRLYLQLLVDQEGVESVGLTITSGAPVISVAESLQLDPRLVQHDNTTLELLSSNGMVDQLAHELGQLTYIPMNRDAPQGMGGKNDADVASQALILVH